MTALQNTQSKSRARTYTGWAAAASLILAVSTVFNPLFYSDKSAAAMPEDPLYGAKVEALNRAPLDIQSENFEKGAAQFKCWGKEHKAVFITERPADQDPIKFVQALRNKECIQVPVYKAPKHTL